MELAFVLLCVLIGTGAIVYAGMRPAATKAKDDAVPTDAVAEDTGEADKPDGGEGRRG